MTVIEKNVITGKVATREYTQKELADIEASKPTQKELDVRNLAELRLKAQLAEEELILMAGATAEAVAYQDAKRGS